MSDELKPCPCGGKANIDNGGTQATVMCEDCYMMNEIQIVDYFTPTERFDDPAFAWQDAPVYGYALKGRQRANEVLTKLWNTRPAEEALKAENERLRECLKDVVTISDRKHDAWDRAKQALGE